MSAIITNDLDQSIQAILDHCGNDIHLFIPLALGKPAQLVNALYHYAKDHPEVSLTIMTALTLERPSAGKGLQKEYLGPIFDRVFADYTGCDYMPDVRKNTLPDNVKVYEFFIKSGGLIGVENTQQNYISSNYTHAARDALSNGVNCIAQMVAVKGDNRDRFSLSCNPEITTNVLLQAQALGLKKPMLIGQVHNDLPYMVNDAEMDAEAFDLIIDNPDYSTQLFGPPPMPVTMNDFMIGLYTSRLVKDAGTLQIGIGALGDAVAYGLKYRHQHNNHYQQIISELQLEDRFAAKTLACGEADTFNTGLYGCSEMFVSGFLELLKAGILKKHVYNDIRLQQWANNHPEFAAQEERVKITPELFMTWLKDGVIDREIDQHAVQRLQQAGILNQQCRWQDQAFCLNDQQWSQPNFDNQELLDTVLEFGLEAELASTFMHGGFFLGPNNFYQELKQLSDDEQRGINMTDIRYMNHLYDDELLKRAQRQDARFINTAFTVSLLGAATSDALENGQVVSGVGGQYNFVSQAHELPDARSILMLKATRTKNGNVSSNIVPHYGHVTIPRHLRDIYISEYGIADVRGKTDAGVIKAMLNIADSRFQPELLQFAKDAGKVEADYEIPAIHRNNTPEALARLWHTTINPENNFPAFPFGSDFTPQEQQLGKALKQLAAAKNQRLGLPKLVWKGWQQKDTSAAEPFLQRLNRDKPSNRQQNLERLALIGVLQELKMI